MRLKERLRRLMPTKFARVVLIRKGMKKLQRIQELECDSEKLTSVACYALRKVALIMHISTIFRCSWSCDCLKPVRLQWTAVSEPYHPVE